MSEPVLSARPVNGHAAPRPVSLGPPRGRPPTPLRLEAHPAGERTVVVAVGEIDMDTCPVLRRSLHAALAASARGIDLDLTGVRFCDCSGLNVLLLAHREASADGRTVVVRSASPAVERLLTVTGTSTVLAPTGDPGATHSTTHSTTQDGTMQNSTTKDSTMKESPSSEGALDGADTLGAEDDLRVEVGQLRRAMQTRPVIDLARGVLMATFGLNPEDAWTVLVTVSQNANIKLHHLAEGTVAAVQGEPLPESLRQQLSAAVAELSSPRGPEP